ncbi:hypothetical protein SKAU_G00149790 [Synaphobranchus kaupii]|uniref:Uncharacterized protein n=1 Tax=Synaphobranchus kaupii TaxID=118154 RepID=A0A9Q1FU69_SYNKA|nr:hypothetical protein SKAU_G00149790 [Synaphobranchus kaupii]
MQSGSRSVQKRHVRNRRSWHRDVSLRSTVIFTTQRPHRTGTGENRAADTVAVSPVRSVAGRSQERSSVNRPNICPPCRRVKDARSPIKPEKV